MIQFEIRTPIVSSPAVCFDLARDIEFHARSLAHTGEGLLPRTHHHEAGSGSFRQPGRLVAHRIVTG